MPDEAGAPFGYARCLERVRARAQQAARALMEQLYPLVIRIARAHLPRRVPEEDLAQEGVHENVHPPRPIPRHDAASALGFAHHRDHLHRPPARPKTPPRVSLRRPFPETEAEILDNVITNENDVNASDSLAARELVHKLLAQLKPRDRMVLQMLGLEQKTLAEISRLTSWNTTLIKVRAFRARRKLREFFRKLKKKRLVRKPIWSISKRTVAEKVGHARRARSEQPMTHAAASARPPYPKRPHSGHTFTQNALEMRCHRASPSPIAIQGNGAIWVVE